MQISVPELTDFSSESTETLAANGVKKPGDGVSTRTGCWPGGWPSVASEWYQGRDFGLTDVLGKLVGKILA